MIKFELKGMDDVKRSLQDLSNRAQNLHGQHNIPLSELMPQAFISSCSRFTSLDELFGASGFEIDSAEDFEAIPDDEWDAFISENTSFNTWEQMQQSAVIAWTQKQLGLS